METSTVAHSDTSELPSLEMRDLRCLLENRLEVALYPLLLLPHAYTQSDACLLNLSNFRRTNLINLPSCILRRKNSACLPSLPFILSAYCPHQCSSHALPPCCTLFHGHCVACICDAATHRPRPPRLHLPRPRPLRSLLTNVPGHALGKLLAQCQSQHC